MNHKKHTMRPQQMSEKIIRHVIPMLYGPDPFQNDLSANRSQFPHSAAVPPNVGPLQRVQENKRLELNAVEAFQALVDVAVELIFRVIDAVYIHAEGDTRDQI